MENIREPRQKRAIDKKNKIIKCGFDLICDKGYYNINTQDIAAASNVSTGIIYQYFNDKHDIFIQGLELYGDKIFYPTINNNIKINKDNLKNVISNMIDNFIKDHKLSDKAHEEIMSMVHEDKDVSSYYYKIEMNLTNSFYNLLINNNFKDDNLKERIHIILGMIDNLCHEIVYHKHIGLNYDIMKNIVVDNIVKIILE